MAKNEINITHYGNNGINMTCYRQSMIFFVILCLSLYKTYYDNQTRLNMTYYGKTGVNMTYYGKNGINITYYGNKWDKYDILWQKWDKYDML